MTAGDQITEEARARLARKINKIYTQVQKDIAKDAEKYFTRFEELAEQKLAQVKAGKISMVEYSTWANNKMLYGERFKNLQDVVAGRLTDTNVTAAAYINDELFDVFMENQNYEHFITEQGCGASFAMYSEQVTRNLIKNNPKLLPKASIDIPKDKRWNQDKMRACLVGGLIRGLHPSKLALELQKVTDMNKVSAMRNARTMITGAQNAGRQASLERADEMGLEVLKEWHCSFVRSRESHMELDGERVKPNEVFSNGCRFPGDHWGEPAEVYNCKCTLDGVFPETPKSTRYDDFKKWEIKKEEEKDIITDIKDALNERLHLNETKVARGIRKEKDTGKRLEQEQKLTSSYISTPSQWSGNYKIDPNLDSLGKFSPKTGDITLHPDAVIKNEIHEMVHTHTIRNGTVEERADFRKLNEGCTEMMTRIICQENGIPFAKYASYNEPVNDLIKIANITGQDHKDFATKLIETPFMDRYNSIKQMIYGKPLEQSARVDAVAAWRNLRGDTK